MIGPPILSQPLVCSLLEKLALLSGQPAFPGVNRLKESVSSQDAEQQTGTERELLRVCVCVCVCVCLRGGRHYVLARCDIMVGASVVLCLKIDIAA